MRQTLLYQVYARWCQEEGTRPAGSRSFATRVRYELGLRSHDDMVKRNGVRYYPSLDLIGSDK